MEILVGILGLVIAWLTYQKTFHSKNTDEKNNLIASFKATQALNNELKNNIELLIEKNNCENEYIFQNVTYKEYIKTLEFSKNKYLSNDLLENISSLKLTKSNIDSMQRSIEQQFNALQLINNEVEFKLKLKNS